MENNDLISRQALLEAYDREHEGEPGMARKLMEDAPAVDAVPVVRGRWNFTDFVGEDWYSIKRAWECSICRHQVESKSKNHIYPKHMKYCPNCGAKMDGDR